MKSLLLLFCFLISTSVFAETLQWNDMELYHRYALTQDIVFENGIEFKSGEKFDMLDFIAGGIPIAYFEMHYADCQNPEQTAELILVDVGPTVIGAQLYEGCNLGIFVEFKDFFNPSAFQ